MQISDNAIGQIIVLASILGGFGLATCAQVALATEDRDRFRQLANSFMLISLHAIFVIVTGVAYFIISDPSYKKIAGIATIAMLALTLIRFIWGLDALATVWLGDNTRGALIIIFLQICLVLLVVLWIAHSNSQHFILSS